MKLIDERELLRAFHPNEMADPISHGKKFEHVPTKKSCVKSEVKISRTIGVLF
jgi:hypothetical protein